jgi:acetyl-CoA C-acetyltransferase
MSLNNDLTPIIVGAGQCVEREYTESSPMDLAGRAASAAIAASGGTGVAEAIDTIAMVKIFSDSAPLWATKLGSSNNPPQSVAKRIGASPKHRIYSETGGDQPQNLLMEFFADLQGGERECVLLCGAEAIKNQRNAERNGLDLDWNEEYEEELEDRGFGKWVVSQQERNNGLIAPMFYYSIMEDARRLRQGFYPEDYAARECEMLEAFNQVAANNPHAQFPNPLTAEDMMAAEPLTHLYTKRMVAQDSVNQGAALILTTVGKAKQLGIPESNWVYMHGAAKGTEHDMTVRPDPSVSAMAHEVVQKAFDMAEINIKDIALIDIYSCFPVAVSAIAEELGLPLDGSTPLTLTGGLAFFGGPGNNYSMHALAEMWSQVRADPLQYAFVHANGGMLSKHATGIFSCEPSIIDWTVADTIVDQETIPFLENDVHPDHGTILACTINYMKGEPVQGIVLAETDAGARFVAHTRPDDQATVKAMLDDEPAGRRIGVRGVDDNEFALHFHFDDDA